MKTVQEKTLPENTSSFVEALLKKYELESLREEVIQKIAMAESPEEVIRLIENLPDHTIIRALLEHAKGKISLEEIPILFQKDLNVTLETAKCLAEDLKNEIISNIKEIPTEEKTKPIEIPQPKVKIPEKPKREDVYREPIG